MNFQVRNKHDFLKNSNGIPNQKEVISLLELCKNIGIAAFFLDSYYLLTGVN